MGRPSDARERLIKAAQRVVFSQSYASVSVDELCAAAGVAKSSFYHFFSSKQDFVLAAIDAQWQVLEQTVLLPTFVNDLPPHERILRFFALSLEKEQAHKHIRGYMRGCPAGNLTLEMSSQDELIRLRIVRFFDDWCGYFERTLCEAQAQGLVPMTLDTATTAQSLLAYYEGVTLLAKGHNDPSLISTLQAGVLALIQYQGDVSMLPTS